MLEEVTPMTRDIRSRPVDRSRLPNSIREAIEDFETANGDLNEDTLLSILDAYLRWEGIHGYTAQILRIFEACLETPPE